MQLSDITTKPSKLFIEVDWDAVQYWRHTDDPDGFFTIPAQLVAIIADNHYVDTGRLKIHSVSLVRNAFVTVNDDMVAKRQYSDIRIHNDQDIDCLYIDGIDGFDDEYYPVHEIETHTDEFDNSLKPLVKRIDAEFDAWIKAQNAMNQN